VRKANKLPLSLHEFVSLVDPRRLYLKIYIKSRKIHEYIELALTTASGVHTCARICLDSGAATGSNICDPLLLSLIARSLRVVNILCSSCREPGEIIAREELYKMIDVILRHMCLVETRLYSIAVESQL